MAPALVQSLTMAKGALPPEPSAGALVRGSRQELSWVRSERLPHMEYRELSTAIALGAISGGGGFLYTGDTSKGLGGLAAALGALVIAPVVPLGLGIVPIALVAAWGALGAYRQAKAINRFLFNQQMAGAEQSGLPMAHGLLASMPARLAPTPFHAQPTAEAAETEHAELLARLRKLASIRASGVIDDNEHRERKIDVLSDVATGLDASATESLLFALLPLLDAGALLEEDLQFVKELGS